MIDAARLLTDLMRAAYWVNHPRPFGPLLRCRLAISAEERDALAAYLKKAGLYPKSDGLTVRLVQHQVSLEAIMNVLIVIDPEPMREVSP